MPPFHTQIEEAARAHGVPTALVQALVQIESGSNPWAVRYEPAFFERYIGPKSWKTKAPCSEQTESRLLACSFGLMQIMGATAREAGFSGIFLTELCDPEIGLEWGCRYLSRLFRRYGDQGIEAVAAAYNAGSPRKNTNGEYVNQIYVNKVRRAGGFA